jgi:hypothetical protein
MARRHLPIVLLACWTLFVPPIAQAADSLLGLVPEGTLGFAAVSRLGEADAKLQKLGQQLQVPIPSLLAQAKQASGLGKGLDEKGAAMLAVLPAAGEGAFDSPPIVLLYLPVTDYKEFLAPLKNAKSDEHGVTEANLLDGTFVVAQKSGYAVFAEPKHLAALRKAVAAPSRTAADLKPLEAWLAENDATVVITRAGVELLCKKVQEELTKVRQMFAQMGATNPEFAEQMKPAIAVFGIYESMFKMAETNVRTVALAAKIDAQGNVQLVKRVRALPGGPLAKIMTGVKPGAANPLAGLPGGEFVVAGGGAVPEGLMQALMDFSVQMMKVMPQMYGLDDEQIGKLMDASKLTVQGIRGMAMSLAVGKGKEPAFSRMAGVMEVDDAAVYLKNYRKYMEISLEVMKGAKQPAMFDMAGTSVKDIQIEGLPAIEVMMKMNFKQPGMETAEFGKIMRAMFGDEGSVPFYMVAADKHTIVIAYTSKDRAAEGVRAVKSKQAGLSADAGVAKTAALLLPKAQWVGYWSPKGTVAFVSQIVESFGPGPGAEKIPAFPDSPPVGMAVKVADGELWGQLVVPAATAKGIADYVKKIVAIAEDAAATFQNIKPIEP